MGKLIFGYKFIDNGHEFFLVGFGLIKIFLKDLDFVIDLPESFLIMKLLWWFLMVIFVDLNWISREDKVLLVLRGSLEGIHTWQGGKIRADLFDFGINVDIELLNTFDKVIEGRFHLFLNGVD